MMSMQVRCFDADFYRSTYSDLAWMNDEEALMHYKTYGFEEGRHCNSMAMRELLVEKVPRNLPVLEIGPWGNPQIRGPQARYADFFQTEELRKRAEQNGLSPDNCPHIDYVLANMSLQDIPEKFQGVFSSHCIEHQPDLVAHFQGVGTVLDEGGRYYLLIPDKRFCFDHFIPESSIADVLCAHEERRTRHALRSLIAGMALTTHNDMARHWAGDHGRRACDINGSEVLLNAISHHRATRERDEYIDCHAWQFTPESFEFICRHLHEAKLSPLKPVMVCHTHKGRQEFCAILEKSTA